MADASILIVEDEMIIALDLQNRLQDLGYIVSATAISGEEALEFVEQSRPDLIVMDIGLLGIMDGIETAEQIRARWNIPIVFLTAYSDAATRKRAAAVAPAAILTKPTGNDELIRAIRTALGEGMLGP